MDVGQDPGRMFRDLIPCPDLTLVPDRVYRTRLLCYLTSFSKDYYSLVGQINVIMYREQNDNQLRDKVVIPVGSTLTVFIGDNLESCCDEMRDQIKCSMDRGYLRVESLRGGLAAVLHGKQIRCSSDSVGLFKSLILDCFGNF